MLREIGLAQFATAHTPRPHVNAFVRPHHLFSLEERWKAAVEARWNVFQFPSEMLQGGDLLSDSGTTALTLEQLSALVLGDTAYGSNWGYFKLLEALADTFGIGTGDSEVYLFHQGRAAEHALYSHLRGERLVVPSNGFFDTTRANAEANGITALDMVDTSDASFMGNIDLDGLDVLLKERRDKVRFVLITITNNISGGQPISMANIANAHALSRQHGISLFLDACRFAENAWFIKKRDPKYEDFPISTIVKTVFEHCDGFTISFKKDGLANMGGALVVKKDAPLLKTQRDLLEKLRDHQILTEGHPTYGGLSGRDIMTIVEGLRQVITQEYLTGRISLVHDFGQYLAKLGIPVVYSLRRPRDLHRRGQIF